MTDIFKNYFPNLPVQVLIPRINGKNSCTKDLHTAYHQVALTRETQKLVDFVIGNEHYRIKLGFYEL